MSLHDVVIHLLRKGLPTSEPERDELIAQVEDDRQGASTPEERVALKVTQELEARAARKAQLEAQLAELG